MTEGIFEVHTSALSTGASAFGSAFSPILEQANRLESLRGTSSTTGRDYGTQGAQYHQAMTGKVQQLITDYAQKCDWVNFNLDANAKDYAAGDANNAATLKSSAPGQV